MKKVTDSLEIKKIKFELNIEEHNRSFSIAARSHDQIAGYPRPEQSARLDYPEDLVLALEEWRTAYHVYYKNISGNQNAEPPAQINKSEDEQTNSNRRRARRARGGNQDERKLKDLIDLEKNLKKVFTEWLENPKILLIRDFIRQKIGVSASDSGIRSHDILFSKVDIFIDCQGEHSKEFRKLPWSEWLILPKKINEENPDLIRFFHTDHNLNSDSTLAPLQEKKSRLLVLVGEYRDLNFKEEIDLFQKLEDKKLADVQFLNANDAEFNTEKKFLDKLKGLLQDDRGWTALALVCHGDDKNHAGEIIISPQRISFTVSRFAESLIMAKQNGLRFAFLGCCRGTLIAQDLVQHGLHQVFFLTEKVGDRLTKEFTKQFVDGLLEYKSVESIKSQITDYFLEDSQKNSFPSAYLLPQIFYHPDTTAQDFYLSEIPQSKTIWRLAKQILPQSQKEVIALCSFLAASTFWFVQDPFQDMRLLSQSFLRANVFSQSQPEPPIQLITIDQDSINLARAEDPNFQEAPFIDRSYLAKIISKLSEFDTPIVAIAYDLTSGPEPTLKNAIKSYLTKKQTLLVFTTNGNSLPSSQFYDPNLSFTGEGSYTPWELSKPPHLNCTENCSFAFQLAQLSALVSQFSKTEKETINERMLAILAKQENTEENISSETDIRLDAFKTLINDQLFSMRQFTHNFREFDIPASNNLDISLRRKVYNFVLKRLFPTSLIDYSIPPHHVYEKMNSSYFLASDADNSHLQKKLRNRVVIIAPGDYKAVQDVDSDLPLSTWYWCSLQPISFDINPTTCEANLTSGEIQAYMAYHYLEGKNLRQASFLITGVIATLVGKIIHLYLFTLELEIRQKKKQLFKAALILTGIINSLIFFFLNLSIPFIFTIPILWYYIFAAQKSPSQKSLSS
ncbi:hypothetical protein Lepto7376_1614 [[Leptolyngbya] sp. PCC 7376]|uniref:CHASE2 domain-containing protein n=1 Tax=[Leptolyngbya] sp. PCC 7376 TaxID=111781 RepID=UPI00029ED7E6|nr:CHASE2 domain-containing protein [[Leptolyngbya] sp. PCC 7376]AFY37950.1 hypothetical protein Lepto7376_1614 [[Leptolyngbya] sp. PCC 7376]